MALTWSKPKDDEWVGMTLTLLIFILAIYIGIKHYKSPGFWWGFGVMFLLAVKIQTGENASFESPVLSVSK